ncbi:MAG: hypothetical protein LAO51_10775 [Acidobacteriia bacterium]|nr:hypothetical protein [Terriglobia bacterium]
MSAALPAVLMGITRLGYRGTITEHALSSLVAHVEEHGLETVLRWIEEDPGLLLMPSWQFFYLP